MTIEEVAVWFQQNILPLLEVALVIVTAYFAYRINKGRLKIEKLVGISEKANLAVKPKTQYHKKEIIVLSNVGTVPIDEIETSLDILISRKNSSDIQLKLEWERRTILNSGEEAVISLHEKLDPVLEENGLINAREVEVPSGQKDDLGEYIMVEDLVRDLSKPFSAIIDIDTKSKIYDSERTIKKKFRFDYDWKPEIYESGAPPDFQFEENFTIQMTELMGKWKDSS